MRGGVGGEECRIKLSKFAETCTHRTSYCKLTFSFHFVMVSCDCRRAKGKRIVLKRWYSELDDCGENVYVKKLSTVKIGHNIDENS